MPDSTKRAPESGESRLRVPVEIVYDSGEHMTIANVLRPSAIMLFEDAFPGRISDQETEVDLTYRELCYLTWCALNQPDLNGDVAESFRRWVNTIEELTPDTTAPPTNRAARRARSPRSPR